METLYEAGYLYKYKGEIWTSDKSKADDESKSQSKADDSQKAGNWSYKERKQSFRLSKKTRSDYASSPNTEEKKGGCCLTN